MNKRKKESKEKVRKKCMQNVQSSLSSTDTFTNYL